MIDTIKQTLASDLEICAAATKGPWFPHGRPWADNHDAGKAIVAGDPDPHIGQIIADFGLTMEWEDDNDDPFKFERDNVNFVCHARNVLESRVNALEIAVDALEFYANGWHYRKTEGGDVEIDIGEHAREELAKIRALLLAGET